MVSNDEKGKVFSKYDIPKFQILGGVVLAPWLSCPCPLGESEYAQLSNGKTQFHQEKSRNKTTQCTSDVDKEVKMKAKMSEVHLGLQFQCK